MSTSPRLVRCPRCQGDAVFAPSNRWRPFCSERCRTGDFAAWANEEFRVPVKPSDDEHLDDAEPTPLH
jgi:endogenous inhibitor of DNA gyrase (YacG/DUF329 family)